MMFLYWRIAEELKYLGEVLVFHDPSLKRCYEKWVCRKAEVLSILDTTSEKKPSPLLRLVEGIET